MTPQSTAYLENITPMNQIYSGSIKGRNSFLRATGLSGKWLDKMQEWQIITPEKVADQMVYSPDDVMIGKLIVEMDRLGLGPKDGCFPEDLKLYTHFVRDFVLPNHMKYLKGHSHLLRSPEFIEKGHKMIEVIGYFFYHLYQKTIKQEVIRILNCVEGSAGSEGFSSKQE